MSGLDPRQAFAGALIIYRRLWAAGCWKYLPNLTVRWARVMGAGNEFLALPVLVGSTESFP